jgi:hypothetical protein
MSRRPSLWLIMLMAGGLSLGVSGPAAAQAAGVDYAVRRGDTLIELAEQYLVSPAAYRQVARLNRIADPRRLPVGRVLHIPAGLLRTVPAEARVVQVRGAAILLQGGSEGPAAVGQIVREGSLISTGGNSFIRLALPDGGHVVLPSHSRVRAVRLRTILLNGATIQDFRLESGRLESNVSPVRPAGGFTVGTPISVSAVRGTQFRSAYNPDAIRSGTEVIEGAVAVAVGGAEIVAGEGRGVAAGAGGARLVDLLPSPALHDPDAVQSGETMVFHLESVAGAVGYRARLATDAGMVDAFAEAESAQAPRLEFGGVADGLYFVRFSAISADGLEGLSEVQSVIRARNGLSGLSASGLGRNYLFRWESQGDGPATFRFQLRPEGSAVPIIDEAGLTEARFTVANLPSGRYVWRARVTRQRFGRLLEAWSEPQSLRISR